MVKVKERFTCKQVGRHLGLSAKEVVELVKSGKVNSNLYFIERGHYYFYDEEYAARQITQIREDGKATEKFIDLIDSIERPSHLKLLRDREEVKQKFIQNQKDMGIFIDRSFAEGKFKELSAIIMEHYKTMGRRLSVYLNDDRIAKKMDGFCKEELSLLAAKIKDISL